MRRRVLAADIGDDKLALASQWGADESSIHARAISQTGDALTDNRGANACIDIAAANRRSKQAFNRWRCSAALVIIGAKPGRL